MAKLRDYIFAFIFVSIFLTIILMITFSMPAYAAVIGYADELKKEDMAGFEKLTFYDTKDENLLETIPKGHEISEIPEYSFLNHHRIVETDDTVTATYVNIGRFHDREISVKMIFSDFERKNKEIDPKRDGRYFAIPKSFRENFHYDGDSLVQKVKFFYSDDPTETAIDMSNAFIVINGLNVDEYAGMAADHKAYVSEHSQLKHKNEKGYECYGNGPQGYSDTCIAEEDEDIKYELNGEYYEEDLSNPLYYVCSVMFMLNGTENNLYIEVGS